MSYRYEPLSEVPDIVEVGENWAMNSEGEIVPPPADASLPDYVGQEVSSTLSEKEPEAVDPDLEAWNTWLAKGGVQRITIFKTPSYGKGGGEPELDPGLTLEWHKRNSRPPQAWEIIRAGKYNKHAPIRSRKTGLGRKSKSPTDRVGRAGQTGNVAVRLWEDENSGVAS